jgi:hypothetical protein
MECCTVAVELFSRTEPITATQYGFQLQFQTHDAPSHNTLWVLKWCQELLVKDSKPQECQCSVHTPDNTEQVREAMLSCPHVSD